MWPNSCRRDAPEPTELTLLPIGDRMRTRTHRYQDVIEPCEAGPEWSPHARLADIAEQGTTSDSLAPHHQHGAGEAYASPTAFEAYSRMLPVRRPPSSPCPACRCPRWDCEPSRHPL